VPVEDQINLSADVTSAENMSEYRKVEEKLASFPEKQQEVFRMMKIEGFSAEEVAKKKGMSISAVKVSAHRTMEKLKEAFR
jgi:RNA polymerase sigma-70 factor (ECF subfamily)